MLQYSAAVINVPFDSDYKNVIDFGSEQEKRGYFSDILGDTPFSPLSNFNVGNGITTTVIYDAPIDFSLFNQLNVNYMIIKDTNNNWFYYFITNVQQLSANRFRYDISIDIFNQYFDKNNFKNKHLIKRCHLDRFVSDSNNQNIIAISEDMYISPPINISDKYPVSLTNGEYTLNNRYTDIIGWRYLYINARKTYNSIGEYNPIIYGTFTPAEYGLIVEPILKNNKICIYKNPNGDIVADKVIEQFRHIDNDTSYVYMAKVLPYPPEFFQITEIDNGYEISYDPSKIQYDPSITAALKVIPKIVKGVISFDNPYNLPTMQEVKSNSTSSYKYPKLYDGGISLVTYIGSDTCEFSPMRALPLDKAFFDIKQSVSINNNSFSLLLKNKNTYTKSASKTFGHVSLKNNQIPVSNGAFENYVANNQNFQLQFASNLNVKEYKATQKAIGDIINPIAEGAGAVVAGKPDKLISAVGNLIQAPIDILGNSVELDNEQAQFNYKIDNLIGAPRSISNTISDADFEIETDTLFPYANTMSIVYKKQQAVIDMFNLYGYEYNKLSTIESVYNNRKYYNYVQAIIDDISGDLSLQVKEQFKRAFASGVRFWHYNGGQWNGIEQYVNNNYERKFDNA